MTAAAAERPGHLDLSEPLLDADELAGRLGIKRKRVYELATRVDDPLPSIRLNRRRRFHRASVEEWLARQAS